MTSGPPTIDSLVQLPASCLCKVVTFCAPSDRDNLRCSCKALRALCAPAHIKLLCGTWEPNWTWNDSSEHRIPPGRWTIEGTSTPDDTFVLKSSQQAEQWAGRPGAVEADVALWTQHRFGLRYDVWDEERTPFAYMANVARALSPWTKHLRHVAAPLDLAIVRTLTSECSELRSLTLWDIHLAFVDVRFECQAVVDLLEPFHTHHLLPSLQLLSSCSSLQKLSLSFQFCKLSRAFTAALSQLTQLRHLEIKIELAFVWRPPHLEPVSLPKVLDALSTLTRLTELSLLLDVDGVGPIAPDWALPLLPSLESLEFHLDNSQHRYGSQHPYPPSCMSALTQLTQLVCYYPGAMYFCTTQQMVRQLPNLVCFEMKEVMDDGVVLSLACCPGLRRLKVAGLELTEELTGVLPELRELVVEFEERHEVHTHVQVEALFTLGVSLQLLAPSLQHLDINAGLTDAMASLLSTHCPHITSLTVCSLQIYDEVPGVVLPALTHVHIKDMAPRHELLVYNALVRRVLPSLTQLSVRIAPGLVPGVPQLNGLIAEGEFDVCGEGGREELRRFMAQFQAHFK